MAAPVKHRTLTSSGTMYAIEAGSAQASDAIQTNQIEPESLTCLFSVLAETDGTTLTGRWQVSQDNSTWYQLDPPLNPAATILATGTSGSDTLTNKVLSPPEGWDGWKFVRAAVELGGVTGVTADTYSMTLTYRARDVWR